MFRSAKNALPQYKGVMTWDYSQADFSVWNIIRKDGVSAGGICKALSAQWIVDHAYGGSLANRVASNGKVNESAIRMVMQNFIAAWDSQEIETASFLLSRGILERQGSRDIQATRKVGVGRAQREITTTSHATMNTTQVGGGNVAIALANALRKVSGCYVQIDFGGSGVGHATAAWIGGGFGVKGGDACFYDPNLGEVWFEDKNKFFSWFEVFYRNSYQGFPCKFNSRWSVRQWALANGAAKGAYAKAVLSVAGR
jgi:YopT peptidase